MRTHEYPGDHRQAASTGVVGTVTYHSGAHVGARSNVITGEDNILKQYRNVDTVDTENIKYIGLAVYTRRRTVRQRVNGPVI